MAALTLADADAALVDAQEALARARQALVATRAAVVMPPLPVSPPAPAVRPLAWGAKISATLRERILLTGRDFEFEPDWLASCIAFETIETFSPTVRPRRRDGTLVSSAVGLIQFLEATARGLGTSTAALAAMSAEKQFDFVWLYFRNSIRAHGPVASLEDCYMHIHWPKAVGKPLSSTMYVKGTSAYAANAGLDTDRDSIVTKAEAGALVRAKLLKGRTAALLG